MAKKIIYSLLGLLIVGFLGLTLYRYFRTYPDSKEDFSIIPWKKMNPTPEATTPINLTTPEELIADQVREQLAEKHHKTLSETKISVEDFTTSHAKGTVIFDGEPGGGWWLAFKEKGGWLLVADGNGTVWCKDTEGYNFPASMVPECRN